MQDSLLESQSYTTTHAVIQSGISIKPAGRTGGEVSGGWSYWPVAKTSVYDDKRSADCRHTP